MLFVVPWHAEGGNGIEQPEEAHRRRATQSLAMVLKILGNDIWGKPLLLLGFMLTIGGIQIITIGIISEILMRTYYESQQKKPYRLKRTITGEH